MNLAQETGGGALGSLPFFLVLLLGMYLLVIRPQRSRAKQMAAVRSALEPGSRVITTAGLHARVVTVDDDTTVLEIAPGVHATFTVQAVVRVLDEPGAGHDAVEDERPDERPPR